MKCQDKSIWYHIFKYLLWHFYDTEPEPKTIQIIQIWPQIAMIPGKLEQATQNHHHFPPDKIKNIFMCSASKEMVCGWVEKKILNKSSTSIIVLDLNTQTLTTHLSILNIQHLNRFEGLEKNLKFTLNYCYYNS